MKHFLLALLALPAYALAEGGLPAQPYIYVEGKAEIEKPADMVTLRFDLSAHDVKQATANKQVQAQAGEVFALLKSINIAETDVVASDLKSEAEYEENDDSTRHHGKFTGYRVTRPFTVKVRDIAAFPKLVDKLVALEVEEFSGIDEGLSNSKDLEDQVWEKAVANARERAEKTLKAAGMKMDSIFAISPVAFPDIQRSIFGGEGTADAMSVVEPSKVNPSQYRLAPVSVSQSVHVIYLISPAK
jgi:uncharacterized protein YggE